MQFAPSGDDGLGCIRIGMNSECWVLLCKLAESNTHLLLIGFRLWLDRDSNNPLGKIHRLQKNLLVLVADGVACRDIAQTDSGCNIACEDVLDFLALVRVHL